MESRVKIRPTWSRCSLDILSVICTVGIFANFVIMGHPFMTSTRRGLAQVDACGRGQAPCGRPRRKLESTDVILSSHVQKFVSFFTRILSLDRIKVEIFQRYKLVIKIINSTV